MVVVEELSGRESDDPKPGDQGANGKDPFADGAVVGGQGGGFAGAEDLTTQTNGHQQGGENEGEPGHSVTFVPYLGLNREEEAGKFVVEILNFQGGDGLRKGQDR